MNAHELMRTRLTPILGEHEARNTVNIAAALEGIIAESPIANLEDHQIIPALATILGQVMRGANVVKAARIGRTDTLQSLYPGDDVILAIVKAGMEPVPEQQRQQLSSVGVMSGEDLARMLGIGFGDTDDDEPVH